MWLGHRLQGLRRCGHGSCCPIGQFWTARSGRFGHCVTPAWLDSYTSRSRNSRGRWTMGTPAISVVHDDWTRLSPAAALAFTARVVNSSLQLDEVLRTVVRLACDVLQADRATILLLDDANCLTPAAAEGRIDDPQALARFREMVPVQLTEIPHALELLASAQAVTIPDVSASLLVPAEWRDAFGLKSL